MGTETEQQSDSTQATASTPASTGGNGFKMSILGRKSGFVIPKNKLSGSLVPLFRGTTKGDGDAVNEESANQVQRKTKWGPDLTLDTTVRKGRVLAYQTRINQISEQLNLGALAIEDNQESSSMVEIHNGKSSRIQQNNEKLEMLELERREIIGEILKLNPSFKAPADYKPLLKEAKVPIPIKEYPGYNFIGLVFGPASDTQKRLEKETGAKIRIYGTKADTGGKVEVTPPDAKESGSLYENLYVHVSADTFEKIDAAVALIELLVTPVSVSAVSSSITTTASSDMVESSLLQNMPTSMQPTLVNQDIAQPYSHPPQSRIAQYPHGWVPASPNQTSMFPQSGLGTPANSSGPFFGNPAQGSSSPFTSHSMPSLFGPRPVVAPSFTPLSQNIAHVPSRPQLSHALQPSYVPPGQAGGPRNNPLALTRPISVRPVVPPSPQSTPLTAFPDNPLPAAGNSRIWLQSPGSTTGTQGPPALSHGVNNMASQNAPSSMISPISGPLQSAGPAGSQPSAGPFSHFLPAAATGSVPSASGPQATIRGQSPDFTFGRPPMPFQVSTLPQHGIPSSVSGNAPNFDSMRPSSAISRPQHLSGDFTFQHHRPPNAVSHVGWQSSQPPNRNIAPPAQTGQSPFTPQIPSIRPVMHHLNPSVHGFPRPPPSHQMLQPRKPSSPNFPGGPIVPRHPGLQGQDAIASPNISHMQQRNFFPPHSNPGPLPPRPGIQTHLPQSHHSGIVNPQRFPTPDQNFGNRSGKPFGSSTVAQQVYDPFSPTAAALNQIGGNVSKGQNESDPEYEDLMASVGVK